MKMYTKNTYSILTVLLLSIMMVSCKVTLITGYDNYIDETTMKMKRDFNKHYFRLVRTLHDTNPDNQRIDNFKDYYDEMEVDILMLQDRSKYLGKKGTIVQQVENLSQLLHQFQKLHERGLEDNSGDDKNDIQNAVNSSLNAITELQMALKTNGKSK